MVYLVGVVLQAVCSCGSDCRTFVRAVNLVVFITRCYGTHVVAVVVLQGYLHNVSVVVLTMIFFLSVLYTIVYCVLGLGNFMINRCVFTDRIRHCTSCQKLIAFQS